MQTEIILAKKLLESTNISILDAARFVRNILDLKEKESTDNNVRFCLNIIELGIKTYQRKSVGKTLIKGFEDYVKSKSNLSEDALRDIKYLGGRLFRICPEMKIVKFSNLTPSRCENWLENVFDTPSQFNKGRLFLSGFFSYAIKHEWIEKNPITLVDVKQTKENEIHALPISQIKQLLKTSKQSKHKACSAALGIMLWAGVRPKEVSRLKWSDIDLDEKNNNNTFQK